MTRHHYSGVRAGAIDDLSMRWWKSPILALPVTCFSRAENGRLGEAEGGIRRDMPNSARTYGNALRFRIRLMVRRYLGYPIFELFFAVVLLMMTLFFALAAFRGCAHSLP